MFLGCQTNNTDITIGCGIFVDFGILAAILLRYLILAQIESVVGPRGHEGVMGRHRRGRDAEQRQQGAGRKGQRVRRSVEECARAVSRECGQVEGLWAPGGATGERGVVLELDDETAGAAVIAELREGVGLRV